MSTSGIEHRRLERFVTRVDSNFMQTHVGTGHMREAQAPWGVRGKLWNLCLVCKPLYNFGPHDERKGRGFVLTPLPATWFPRPTGLSGRICFSMR